MLVPEVERKCGRGKRGEEQNFLGAAVRDDGGQSNSVGVVRRSKAAVPG